MPKAAAWPSLDDDSQQVLLDLEVDGVRCLLVRSQQNLRRGSIWLTPREREIARMVARGYPNKTIAANLDISAWTVSTHLRRMFAKVGVCSRAALIARILGDGCMSPPCEEAGSAQSASYSSL